MFRQLFKLKSNNLTKQMKYIKKMKLSKQVRKKFLYIDCMIMSLSILCHQTKYNIYNNNNLITIYSLHMGTYFHGGTYYSIY